MTDRFGEVKRVWKPQADGAHAWSWNHANCLFPRWSDVPFLKTAFTGATEWEGEAANSEWEQRGEAISKGPLSLWRPQSTIQREAGQENSTSSNEPGQMNIFGKYWVLQNNKHCVSRGRGWKSKWDTFPTSRSLQFSGGENIMSKSIMSKITLQSALLLIAALDKLLHYILENYNKLENVFPFLRGWDWDRTYTARWSWEFSDIKHQHRPRNTAKVKKHFPSLQRKDR